MDITDEERRLLGAAAEGPFRRIFKRNKRSAYTAASVSPATLDKFFLGDSVRDDKLQALVDVFWPDADGDWRAVLDDGSVGTDPDSSYVSAPGATREGGATNDEVLAAVQEMRAELRDVQRRLEVVEQQGAKPVGRARGKGGSSPGPS